MTKRLTSPLATKKIESKSHAGGVKRRVEPVGNSEATAEAPDETPVHHEPARAESNGPPPPPPVGPSRFRWGFVVGLGVPLIVLNNYWIAFSEMRTGVTEITITTPFMGVIFLLFILIGINALVGTLFPRARLSQAELLALYFMLNVSSSVGGVGAVGFFLPFLGNITWFADQNNHWDRFHPYLPDWFAPSSRHVLEPFYHGNSTIFQAEVLKAWAVPLLLWGLFFWVLIYVTLCAASLLRYQWIDAEHLPFPSAFLPVEMTREGGPFFRNRTMWFGFALPFVIQSFNSLNSIYPNLPYWHVNRLQDLHPWFSQKPWSGVDAILTSLHPLALGLIFIAPLDLSFSVWVFYWGKKLMNVFGVAQGWRDPDQGWGGIWTDQFPYAIFQGAGGWIALAVVSLWTARHHLKRMFLRAVHGDPNGLDANEAMSSRAAFLGLLLGTAALSSFSYAMGAPLWLPPVFLTLYLMLMIVFSRIIAEVGPPSPSLDWCAPQNLIIGLMGTKAFSTLGLVNVAALSWFNLDTRAAAMPRHFEAMRIAGLARMRLRPLTALLLLAAAVAIPAALLCSLEMYYQNGAATAKVNPWRIDMARLPWNALDDWERNPKGPNAVLWSAGGIGAGATLLLAYFRMRIIGFPFHPVAYPLVSTFSAEGYWFDFFAGWLCKFFILRYGGMRIYRRALPFFLGLVLGDFIAGAGWSLLGTFLNLNLYRTFPT